MAKYTHEDIVGRIKYSMANKGEGYTFPTMREYNMTVGNINPSCYTVVTGLPGSGRTTFVSQNYILNVLLQWYFTVPEDREPLKIFYFTTTMSELKIRQLLLCQYIKLVHNTVIDIPTLNSQPGAMYSLTAKREKAKKKAEKVLGAIEESGKFFNTIVNEGILEIIEGPKQPSTIFNTVGRFMETIGEKDDDDIYTRSSAEDGSTLVMVAVDNTEHLQPESDEFSTTMYGEDLDKRMDEFMIRMRAEYDINGILITNSSKRLGLVRSPSEMRPHYKHLGVYGHNCDIGVGLFAPNKEGDTKWLEDSKDRFISERTGMDTLRMWKVVRHSTGPDFKDQAVAFHGACGFWQEVNPDVIGDFSDIKEVFSNETEYVEMKTHFDESQSEDWEGYEEE